MEEDMENPAVLCLNMAWGASTLLAQHKVELAQLLPTRGPKARSALERLVADLMEVLTGSGGSSGSGSSTITTTITSQQPSTAATARVDRACPSEERGVAQAGQVRAAGGGGAGGQGGGVASTSEVAEGGAATGPASSPPPDSRVKRAKGPPQQQAAQRAQQGGGVVSTSAPATRDPLSIEEVVEHVMSFAGGHELVERLSHVSRLWRRVAEGERLCLPVLQRHVPVALLGGASSLHQRLGGSAWRCLLAHGASLSCRSRLLCHDALSFGPHRLNQLACLIELSYRGVPAAALHSRVVAEEDATGCSLNLYTHAEDMMSPDFSAEMMGVDNIHRVFMSSFQLRARYSVMDVATGVTASLFNVSFCHRDAPPDPDDMGAFNYKTRAAVTSMTYAGPPLEAELHPSIGPREQPEEEELPTLHLDTHRMWNMGWMPCLTLVGPSAIYCEKFIWTRLAEEMRAANQRGKPWWYRGL